MITMLKNKTSIEHLIKIINLGAKNCPVGRNGLRKNLINPFVPRVQKIKIRNLTINPLPIVEFIKKMVYLGAHYSEHQGLMG